MIIPDYIEPFTAYRVWTWEPEGVKSLNGTTIWPPAVALAAECARIYDPIMLHRGYSDYSPAHHHPPAIGCTCGIYAAKNLQHLIDIDYARMGIHGEVALWGKIEECSLGYRAQYAYPKHFIIPPGMLPWKMAEMESRLQTLIAFDVDIYISNNDARLGKVPLWVKGYGYSQQGTSLLLEKSQKYYDYDNQPPPLPEVGDRIAVNNSGIGVILRTEESGIIIMMFNRFTYRVPWKGVAFNRQNNRWECDTDKLYLCGISYIPPLPKLWKTA